MPLQVAVEELARQRLVMAARSQRVKEIHAELNATPKGQEMIDAHALLTETKERVKTIEETVRSAALAIFEDNGDKQPAPGIGIRKATALEYDPSRAKTFCMKKGYVNQLNLNVSKFKTLACTIKPKFVTFTETHTATIARDLSGALAKARKEAGE